MILRWLRAEGMPAGHFRPDPGKAAGSIFMPRRPGGEDVLRCDTGEWVVLGEARALSIVNGAAFALHYEVIP
ncbi:MAG: hypothetical protein ACOH2H_15315 [Cypionkella sp.]